MCVHSIIRNWHHTKSDRSLDNNLRDTSTASIEFKQWREQCVPSRPGPQTVKVNRVETTRYPAGLDRKPLRDIAYKHSTHGRGRVRWLGSGWWVKLRACSSPFVQHSITFQMKSFQTKSMDYDDWKYIPNVKRALYCRWINWNAVATRKCE